MPHVYVRMCKKVLFVEVRSVHMVRYNHKRWTIRLLGLINNEKQKAMKEEQRKKSRERDGIAASERQKKKNRKEKKTA